MAGVTISIAVRGGSALRELMGYERQSKRNASADRAAGSAAEAAAKKQQAAADRAAVAAAKAAEKAANARSREAKRAADAEAREAARSAQNQQREADKLARHWQTVQRRSTDFALREAARRERAEEQSIAARKRSAEKTLRTAGGIAGGVVAGVLAGGVSAGMTARQVSGVQDVATRVQQGIAFRKQLVIAANQAGIGDQVNAIQSNALQAARASGQDPLAISAGLARAHEEFNAFKLFSDNIGAISKAATASGSDVQDFVGMLGNMRRAFQLSDDDLMKAMHSVAAGAQTGSVSLANFARDFPAAAGIFATNTGQRGLQGVKQFSALAQTVATGGFGPAESATRVERFSADINDVKVRQGLRSIGIRLPKEGQPLDVGNLIGQLAGNKQFARASIRQGIFKETRALQAVEAMVAAKRAVDAGQVGAVDFATQMGVTATSGAADLNKSFGALEAQGLIDMQRQAIDMQADTIEKLKDYNDQVVSVTKVTNAFEKALGTSSLWLSSLGVGGLVGGGVGLGAKFFGGGAGGAAAGLAGKLGAGGLLAKLGTGVASAGAGAVAGTVAAGAALGAGAGMLIDRVPRLLGSENNLSDMAGNWLARVAPWDVSRAKGFEVGGEIKTTVEVTDKRVSAKQEVIRDRGVRINPSAGLTMPGSGT